MKKSLFSCFSLFFLCGLLFFPKIAFDGASCGLLLWFQTVLPTLFPFMFASKLAVLTKASRFLTKPFAPLLCSLTKINEDGVYTLLTGMLCGYPMGAKTCSDFMKEGRIDAAEGRFLFSLCNLPSPMFLLGYLHSQTGGMLPVPLILQSVYVPLLPLGVVSWYCYLSKKQHNFKNLRQTHTHFKITSLSEKQDSYKTSSEKQIPLQTPSISLDDILSECSLIFIRIGCYMMLFSVLAAFFLHLPLPASLQAFLAGIMEMTTGIHTASKLLPAPISWLFMVWFCVFGGFSGLFQIKSVTKNAGLSIRHYLFWKMAHASLSVLYLTAGLWLSGYRIPPAP